MGSKRPLVSRPVLRYFEAMPQSTESQHLSVRSSIDLGTNTCLLLVAQWDFSSREIQKVLGDFATVVRLGQGVDLNRAFISVAMERTLTCLKDYALKLRALGGDTRETICVATSGSRDAANSADFFAQVERETGFKFRRISGDDEARLTHLGGLLPGMTPEKTAVIDIGGGSTEYMIAGRGQSVDIGSVRFTERYLKTDPNTAVSDEQFWKCQAAVDDALLSAEMPEWRAALSGNIGLCAVAGTATTLAAWQAGMDVFNAERIDQIELTRGDVHRAVEELKWRTVEERRKLPGIEEGRADVLLAGALILWRSMEILNFASVRISSRGLRFGALRALDP